MRDKFLQVADFQFNSIGDTIEIKVLPIDDSYMPRYDIFILDSEKDGEFYEKYIKSRYMGVY